MTKTPRLELVQECPKCRGKGRWFQGTSPDDGQMVTCNCCNGTGEIRTVIMPAKWLHQLVRESGNGIAEAVERWLVGYRHNEAYTLYVRDLDSLASLPHEAMQFDTLKEATDFCTAQRATGDNRDFRPIRTLVWSDGKVEPEE